MKIRRGFITNSSSTAYIIRNTSDETKTLVDFVVENKYLLDDFKAIYYDNEDDTLQKMVEEAEELDIIFEPDVSEYCVFGDEQWTVIGKVYDYMLRWEDGSENFAWRVEEYLR